MSKLIATAATAAVLAVTLAGCQQPSQAPSQNYRCDTAAHAATAAQRFHTFNTPNHFAGCVKTSQAAGRYAGYVVVTAG